MNWRVLGYDAANNKLLLVSSTPTKNTGLLFEGYEGYNNYIDVLNNTCKALYSNSSIGANARSINMDDLDTYLGTGVYNKQIYGNTVDASGKITEIKAGGYGYTATILNSYHSINPISGNLTYLGPSARATMQTTGNAYKYVVSDVVKDTTQLELINGPTYLEKSYSYWIADRCTLAYSGYVKFCLVCATRRTLYEDGYIYGMADVLEESGGNGTSGSSFDLFSVLSFRPVVTLPNSVTTDDVSVIAVAPTEEWESIYSISPVLPDD